MVFPNKFLWRVIKQLCVDFQLTKMNFDNLIAEFVWKITTGKSTFLGENAERKSFIATVYFYSKVEGFHLSFCGAKR